MATSGLAKKTSESFTNGGWQQPTIYPQENNQKTDYSHPIKQWDNQLIGDVWVPKTELPEYARSLKEKNDKNNANLIRHLKQILESSPFLKQWEEEGIQRPTNDCKQKSLSIALSIYDEYEMLPIRIAQSIEEGVVLVYKNDANDKSLIIELYNNDEMAGLVNQNKSIILSIDIENEIKDIRRLFQTYNEL